MSKISQIEAALSGLDSGVFPKFCSIFLNQKYNVYPKDEGSVKGEDKNKTGTPDSFVIQPNGNFIFIEYTTQKTGVKAKFLKDLKKCFNEEKTGVPIHKIDGVYLCFNSELKPEETNEITEYCLSHNTGVEFIDLSFLKYEIYDYPRLAKDFLDVETDTEQILKPFDFIKEVERKGTSQTNDFFGRKEELSLIEYTLKDNNIIVIPGNKGVGKTRIAMEAISSFINENTEYEPYCILTKGLPLYHDMKAYFRVGHKYIVLVDDANRIGHLSLVLEQAISQKYEVKIIITVRDFVFGKVKRVLDEEKHEYKIMAIEPLGDEIVRDILQSIGITNSLCVNNISRIANGNPRLVMMSAVHAISENDCQKLHDVVDIYDLFFAPYVSSSELQNKTILSVFGIMSFFRVVDKNDKELMDIIYQAFNISEDDFWGSIYILHGLEFIDLHKKHIAKIPDQVLANYIFYFVFLKKEVLDFSVILTHFLSTFKGKVKESLYPVLDYYRSGDIMSIISPKLDKRLLEITGDEELLLDFYEVFSFYRQEDILLFAQKSIGDLPLVEVKQSQFRVKENNDWWSIEKKYPYFKLLKLFGEYPNDLFEFSLELLVKYIEKSPELLPHVIKYFEEKIIFNENDHRYGYLKQIILFDFIYRKIEKEDNIPLFTGMLSEIAPTFLRTYFRTSSSGRVKNTIKMYDVFIQEKEEIKSFRQKIFDKTFSLYSQFPESVLTFLEKYVSNWEHKPQTGIYETDSKHIVPFLRNQLSSSSFRHCKIVHYYMDYLERLGIKLPEKAELESQFSNKVFGAFRALTYDYSDWYREKRGTEVEEYNKHKKQYLITFFSGYSLNEYFEFISDVEQYLKYGSNDQHTLFWSMEIVLINLLEKSPDDCLSVLSHLFSIQNPYQFQSFSIVNKLFDDFSPDKVSNLITKHPYTNQQYWQLHFFIHLREKQVTQHFSDKLLSLFSSFKGGLYFDIKPYVKYIKVDPRFLHKALKILIDRAKLEDIRLDLNKKEIFETYFHEFNQNLPLLKDAYFHCSHNQQLLCDDEGKYFRLIFDLDNGFVEEFLKHLFSIGSSSHRHGHKFNLFFIWDNRNVKTIMDRAIQIVAKNRIWSEYEYVASMFFPSNDLNDRIDNFFKEYIEKHFDNKESMYILFGIIFTSYSDKRIKYLKELLKYNSDMKFWQSLPIASNGFSGVVSSLIPYYEGQIDFWESLLPIFTSKLEYLRLRQWVKNKIKGLKDDINRELERSFIQDY